MLLTLQLASRHYLSYLLNFSWGPLSWALGLISAVFMSPVFDPPRSNVKGRTAGSFPKLWLVHVIKPTIPGPLCTGKMRRELLVPGDWSPST